MKASDRHGAAVVLGVDPGSVDTGFVVRRGSELVAHTLIHRAGDETGPRGIGLGPLYRADVVDTLRGLIKAHHVDLVGIEGVKKPSGFRRGKREPIDPGPLMAASIVLGWCWGVVPSAVIVSPANNGSGALLAYPEALRSAAEARLGLNRVGGGQLRHCRSAWDVAGQAELLSRM